MDILFILRKSGAFGPYAYHSSGLRNSATFINDMLVSAGVSSRVAEVNDANDIDREVFNFNPSIVILEAIWCPPSKLGELAGLRRHKGRRWVVRNHSELPFLSLEGIAMKWLLEYPMIPAVSVACNSNEARYDLDLIFASRMQPISAEYLPNFYPVDPMPSPKAGHRSMLNIGCFGALRPLKNQLMQAAAASVYAASRSATLAYHINSTRIENDASPVLKSIRAIFSYRKDQMLVEHPWMERPKFLALCREMDLGLQVSFSETFNIVSADLVSQGVPVVVSSEVPWVPIRFQARPTSIDSIIRAMGVALRNTAAAYQLEGLLHYSARSAQVWLEFIRLA